MNIGSLANAGNRLDLKLILAQLIEKLMIGSLTGEI